MRGVALTLVCPRCNTERPPAGDRRPIQCASCALVFTSEQGERAHARAPRRSEAATSRATALVRSPVRGVRVVSVSPLRLRLAKSVAHISAPLIGGFLGSVVAAVTLATHPIGWAGAIVGLAGYVIAFIRYQPADISLGGDGLSTATSHLALGELDVFRAEHRWTKFGYDDVVLVTTKQGKLVELGRAASLAAAEDVAARLAEEVARLRRI